MRYKLQVHFDIPVFTFGVVLYYCFTHTMHVLSNQLRGNEWKNPFYFYGKFESEKRGFCRCLIFCAVPFDILFCTEYEIITN